jgi:hypothetical protein
MRLPKIVLVCGGRRSGKDYLAEYLEKVHGYIHIKISRKLKEICKLLFAFSNEQMETDSKEMVDLRWGVSPRRCMQFIGTEFFQDGINNLLIGIGKTFWINSLLNELDSNKRYVISDLRFFHEYEEIMRRCCNIGVDVCVIRIYRINSVILPDNDVDNHVSEQEYKKIPADVVLINDGVSGGLIDDMLEYLNLEI